MRRLLATLALGLLGALALSGQAARDTPPERAAARPAATAAPPAPAADAPPLLQRAGDRHVRRASPRTLRPAGKPIRLPLPANGGVLSPDGRRAALLGVERDVVVLDVARERSRRVRLPGPLVHPAWLTDDRFVVFSGIGRGGTDLVEVDAREGRVLSRTHLRAEAVAAARSRDGVVAVLAPPGRIGRASLLVLRPGRPDRTVPLTGLRAGFDRIDPGDTEMRARNVQPGLAVDPGRDVAYVVDAETDRLAEVDLRSRTARNLPLARAAKVVDSRVRYAAWLGGGKLAVAGHRDREDGRIDPHGLRVVDVRDPQRRQVVVAPRQDFLAAGEGRVVAWQIDGGGIAVHDRRGRLRHRLLRGVLVPHVEVHGPYAYVHTQTREGRNAATRVVDLRSGRLVGRGRAAPVAVASTTRAPARATVLGVAYPGGPAGRLAPYDPVTLRRRGRGAVVHGRLWDWDRSPDGRRIALAVSNRGRIEVFAARAPRRARRIEIPGRREAVRALRWVRGGRLLALHGRAALEIDASTGQVLARHRLRGADYEIERTADGLAVLTGPREGEGEAALVLLRAGQAPRRVALPGVRVSRYARTDHRPGAPPQLHPGLAADGAAAFVAPPLSETIVRVDLASGAVTSHAFRARAAKGGAVRSRSLEVLGGGRLLRTGYDLRHNGYPEMSMTEVVDTATWRRRVLSGHLTHAVGSPAGIVVPRYRERFFTVHAPDGRRLARHRPRYGLSDVRVHGRYAYVLNGAHHTRNRRTHVVDLRSGRRVRALPTKTLPQLLIRP